MAKCAVCGRTLKSPRSIAAGFGPVCGRGGKGRRHKSPRTSLGGGGSYRNGASGAGLGVAPAAGGPMERDEALAIIGQIASLTPEEADDE